MHYPLKSTWRIVFDCNFVRKKSVDYVSVKRVNSHQECGYTCANGALFSNSIQLGRRLSVVPLESFGRRRRRPLLGQPGLVFQERSDAGEFLGSVAGSLLGKKKQLRINFSVTRSRKKVFDWKKEGSSLEKVLLNVIPAEEHDDSKHLKWGCFGDSD